MNIWFISKYASPPKYSKMPSRLFNLAYEFSKRGHNVSYITSDSNHFSNYPKSDLTYNLESFENILFIWVKTFKYSKTASISRLLSWFDFELKLFRLDIKKIVKPDVIHISSLSIFTIIYGYYLKRKFNAKLVFEIRDIWPLTMTEEGGFSKWHPLVLLVGYIEKFGYRNSDLIVGTMPRLDLHVKNILGYVKPFYCLPLGFNPDDYVQTSNSKSNPFDYLKKPDKIIVGYAGSMGITNALESFIESIKLLVDEKTIHFYLVGSGDLKNKFQSELKDFTNVTFLDRIEQYNVRYFLEVCDILYLSTKNSKVWDFGQSMNKVVEYMLASKPIIATYSGYPSMIDEAGCGYYVDHDPITLSNKFIQLSKLHKNELNEIGSKGRSWVYENRQYRKLAMNYINVLDSIVTKKNSQ